MKDTASLMNGVKKTVEIKEVEKWLTITISLASAVLEGIQKSTELTVKEKNNHDN